MGERVLVGSGALVGATITAERVAVGVGVGLPPWTVVASQTTYPIPNRKARPNSAIVTVGLLKALLLKSISPYSIQT
jgi:hypothetical protein